MKILNAHQIDQKITRLAIEILENNLEEDSIILAGINKKGLEFARLLHQRLATMSEKELVITQVTLPPADPLSEPARIALPVDALRGKSILLLDDVANTGRTIFYACRPLLDTLPKRLQVAVLVDRTHKLFPIRVDYVGLSLATTLLENIEVLLPETSGEAAVFLE